MKALPIKPQILVLNLLFMGLAGYILFEDYQRVGKFQWTDPWAVEDHEEMYLNVISVFILFLGSISIITQISYKHLLTKNEKSPLYFAKLGLDLINGFYGVFLCITGMIFLFSFFENLGNNSMNSGKELGLFLLFISIFACLGYLGFLILKQIFEEKR